MTDAEPLAIDLVAQLQEALLGKQIAPAREWQQLLTSVRQLRAHADSLFRMLERTETQHVTFTGPDGEQFHPDWCRECRVDRLAAALRDADELGDRAYKHIDDWDEGMMRAILDRQGEIIRAALARHEDPHS